MASRKASFAILLGYCLFILHVNAFTLAPATCTSKWTIKVLSPSIMERRLNRATVSLKAKLNNDSDDDNDDRNESAWLGALVLPLWVVYVSNQWSRSSIYYLVNFSGDGDAFTAMNVDLDFSQSQYGLLASVAFTSLFAIASLGAGLASDRYNRKLLTIASSTAWSVATLGTALSASYGEVVLWRIAMGLACAFSTPTAYTLLSEKVPEDRGALASSLYGTGVALGGALASLSLLLDSELGWRNALIVIAVFGFGAAGLNTILLPDDPKVKLAPSNEMERNQRTSSIVEEVSEVVSTSRVKWLFLASFLRFSAGLSIGIWSAAYFRGAFPDNVSEYAVAQAAITSVCGVASGVFGGIVADWLSSSAVDSSDPVGRKLWVPVVGSVLAVPAFYYSINSGGSFELAMICLAVEYLVAECWFGPTISVLQTTVGPKIGGTAQGLFTLTGAVGNLTPSLLGFVYAQAAGIDASAELAEILTAAVCSLYLASAACFVVSSLSTPPTMSLSRQTNVLVATESKRK